MSDNLIHQRWDGIVTTNRCHAIHWLKTAQLINHYKYWHPIKVYRTTGDKIAGDKTTVEIWLDFVPKNNNYSYGGVKIDHPETNMIYGTYWDKHHNRWAYGCMPATKEVKYLKDYRVD